MFGRRNLLDELVEYFKKNLKKGYTKDSLKWALLNQGYSKIEIEKAMRTVDIELAEQAPILKTKPKIEYKAVPLEEEAKQKKKRWFS